MKSLKLYAPSKLTRMFGLFLVLCGLGAAVYFYGFFETSIEVPTTQILGTTVGGGRVANLSLMQDGKTASFSALEQLSLGGSLCFSGARPRKLSHRMSVSVPSVRNTSRSKPKSAGTATKILGLGH